MAPRELLLLSHYRLPAQNALMLGNEDVSAFLNGYSALWHPALLRGAAAPPRVVSPYDYEQPAAGHIYAVPDSPPPILPEDWEQRVRQAGAITFFATADRDATLANLREALSELGDGAEQADAGVPDLWQLATEQVAPFFGIGFGFLHVDGLFEAMEHENLLARDELWQDVQAAAASFADAASCRRHLQSAADRLLAAREILYPVAIHIVDLCLLDENRLAGALPAAADRGCPFNIIACASLLEKLAGEQPDLFACLRERVANDTAEVCGGAYQEREDPLLPFESQLWNLQRGLAVSHELLGREIGVYARKRFAFHPQVPLLLVSAGLKRTLFLAFDDAVLPNHRTIVVNWPSSDGKQVEAFTRTPYPADNPQTYFHVAHYLHRSIMQDHAATLVLLHAGAPAAPWYGDWLELSRLSPVLGQWTTLSRYFNEVPASEFASNASPDEFHGDHLSDCIRSRAGQPVTSFSRHLHWRRRVDAAWTLAALHRSLGAPANPEQLGRIADLEAQLETGALAVDTCTGDRKLDALQQETAEALAQRLLARATDENAGYLFLNPCGFARRVALELEGLSGPLPLGGPLKTCQVDGTTGRVVVEVPALGFAWIPQKGPAGTVQAPPRMRLADQSCVRNEFFEAEIDLETGGLRALRDHRTRINRLGQQLVFNPASTMRAAEVKVTIAGPALGEVVTEGAILDQDNQVLATYRQRFRAWLGRPLLELRIEIQPRHAPEGYPWHAYYGARFAWRDERAVLLRGMNGMASITSHTRPETPDFLELRLRGQSTLILPEGLPFHQRHGGRMLDVILVPEGETGRSFDLAIALDRDYPMQTALGLASPVPMVAVAKGPPPVGPAGWLFHVDAPNLMLTSLRPAGDGAKAIVARLLECSGQSCQAELRCVRDPRRAVMLDVRGTELMEAAIQGDAVLLDVAGGDLVQVRVEFE